MSGKSEQQERFLCEQDAIWAAALADILSAEGIALRMQQVYGAGLSAYVGPICERTEFYVPAEQLERAKEIVRVLFSQTVLEPDEDALQEAASDALHAHIRRANSDDSERIAEIEVFNYRLNFFPIFRNDDYYFNELRVSAKAAEYEALREQTWVYDDGVVKGFIRVDDGEIRKLFVEPVLQGNGIGAALLDYATAQLNAGTLWALEKNERAIAFYQRHGFCLTGEKKLEEDTDEYLVCLQKRAGV